jgi:hypothetical protein
MFPFIGNHLAYGRAVRQTAEHLLTAHGDNAIDQAWRAARLPSLTKTERVFCEAVAVRVAQELERQHETVTT